MNTITINITHAEAALLQSLLNAETDRLGALPLPVYPAEAAQVERLAMLAAKLAH